MGYQLKCTTRSWGGYDEGHFLFSFKSVMPYGMYSGKNIRNIYNINKRYLIELYYKFMAVDFTADVLDLLNIRPFDKPATNEGFFEWMSDKSIHTLSDEREEKEKRINKIYKRGRRKR